MPRTRSDEPIRRHSLPKGSFEHQFYRPITRAEASRMRLAAARIERDKREKGKRIGPLGHVALEALSLLTNVAVNSLDGRLDMAYETMARHLRRSKSALAVAIERLEAMGFLERIRRFVPTGAESGPQVQQTSNAYRLLLPAIAVAALAPIGAAPVPADHEHAQATAEALFQQHAKSAPLPDYAKLVVGDDPLGQALARLGAGIAERESAGRTESPSRSLVPADCGAALSGGETLVGRPSAADGLSGGRAAGSVPPKSMRSAPG